jgi:hypothetical protein
MIVSQSGDFMISIPQILHAISDRVELFKLLSLSEQVQIRTALIPN